jgi:transcriptional regulator GlxA family with amidase domain
MRNVARVIAMLATRFAVSNRQTLRMFFQLLQQHPLQSSGRG